MNWNNIFLEEQQKEYYKNLINKVNSDRLLHNVYPKEEDIFRAFDLTPYKDVKVVILGQDPYHNPNQAHGLSFSVNNGIKLPPSLKNIYKEYNTDLGYEIPKSGNLDNWAKQGVLLLNTYLTVIENKPMSHSQIGWEIFTDNIIKSLNNKDESIIYILMGNFAQTKESIIDQSKHKIIKCAHPSPFSAYRGFFGSRIFSRTNELLDTKINWKL